VIPLYAAHAMLYGHVLADRHAEVWSGDAS